MVVVLELVVVVVAAVEEEVVVDLLVVLQILQTFHWAQYNKILWVQHFLSEACCCIPS